ncbi:MAG: ribosomal RNA small subunit methyltransferase A [Desulfonatronovibrio sp. MSAO_Bac4]|nr:MAG: ribosomal RNA small subunit methyltransferase A [Desulfonatronovibrio sp. MSAO_Bac4]
MKISAKKSLGQNFLIDANICRKIVSSLDICLEDNVLEIGPGKGALTGIIYHSGCNFYCLEKDNILSREIKYNYPQASVINVDALNFDWPRLNHLPQLKIVGNLPYNVASRLIWDIVAQVSVQKSCTFMVQKEVGQRIAASPGSKTYGALSVWVQSHVRPELLFTVSPCVFRPKPKVDSAVLGFYPVPLGKKNFSGSSLNQTLRLMFQNRRKQVGNILKNYWNDGINSFFERKSLDLRIRPENLSPDDFQELSSVLFPWKN